MLSTDNSKPPNRRARRVLSSNRALRRLEFCDVYGISPATFDRRVKAGEIRVVKIGHASIVTEDELRRLGLMAV